MAELKSEKIRRVIRGKVFNILERLEQLEDEDEVGTKHLDSAIKSLTYQWEEIKKNGSAAS